MVIKKYKEIICDVCGMPIETRIGNVTIKGAMSDIARTNLECGVGYKVVSRRFDMCSKCLSAFKDFIKTR